MTDGTQWDRFRGALLDEAGLGFRLDLSRMGLPDGWLAEREAAMQDAMAAMAALERGSIANPDEGRMVGHYWLRKPSLAPSPALAQLIDDTRRGILTFAQQVHDGTVGPRPGVGFRHLLVIGIGGSALGPQLIADALGSANDALTVQFLDNTDPDGFDRVLSRLGDSLADTLVVVISKSGGTPETRNGLAEVAAAFNARQLPFGQHAVAITQEGSALDRHAAAAGFLAHFPMWDWVGGRTSVTSAVGLLPAALQGIDISALLAGAEAMDEVTRRKDTRRNPAALMALCWYFAGNGLGSRDLVVLPYKDRLSLLGRYLQQLIMESLGKERDLKGRLVHQGLSVYGNKGSTDQHAYIQQLRDGLANFFVTFIGVMTDRAGQSPEIEPGITSGDYLHGFLLGTRRALHDNGRASLTLTLKDAGAHSLGMLIALFERTVGLYASLIGVNAYHQPGVEAGKRAAAAVLELQRLVVGALESRPRVAARADEVARWLHAEPETEDVFHILEHLAANEGRGIVRVHESADPTQATFTWKGSHRQDL